jgi:hypothetical protein
MKTFILVSMLALAFIVTACDEQQNSDTIQRQQQEQILKEATAQTGMPAIVNFRERKLLKQIIEMRDQENLITYTYIVSEVTGKLIYVGRSIGFGIPYATQYTNPEKIVRMYSEGYGTLPQADPNGLFSPGAAEGTWVMLIDEKTGNAAVCYFEPRIVVSPFPLPVRLIQQ